MTIRAVFFDLGGVILRTEYQAPRQQLAERLGLGRNLPASQDMSHESVLFTEER